MHKLKFDTSLIPAISDLLKLMISEEFSLICKKSSIGKIKVK